MRLGSKRCYERERERERERDRGLSSGIFRLSSRCNSILPSLFSPLPSTYPYLLLLLFFSSSSSSLPPFSSSSPFSLCLPTVLLRLLLPSPSFPLFSHLSLLPILIYPPFFFFFFFFFSFSFFFFSFSFSMSPYSCLPSLFFFFLLLLLLLLLLPPYILFFSF